MLDFPSIHTVAAESAASAVRGNDLSEVAILLVLAMAASFSFMGFMWLWIVRETSTKQSARIYARLTALVVAMVGAFAILPFSLQLDHPSANEIGVFGMLLALAGFILCFGDLAPRGRKSRRA